MLIFSLFLFLLIMYKKKLLPRVLRFTSGADTHNTNIDLLTSAYN